MLTESLRNFKDSKDGLKTVTIQHDSWSTRWQPDRYCFCDFGNGNDRSGDTDELTLDKRQEDKEKWSV